MKMTRTRRILAAAATGIALLAGLPAAGAADRKPNILFILADDLGWKDVGFHGSDIRTPAIDELAAGGARLEQFYAQPMCTPTRATLMTGRYPWRYGLQTIVIPAGYNYGLPTDEYLLPQALKDAGYTTALIGKWHLGHGDRKYWPRNRGFDYHYGPLIGEIDYFTHEADGVVDWFRNNQKVVEKGYSTTLLGNEAVRFIQGHDPAKPLYMYLAFNAPHTPYQAPQEYLDKYKNVADPNRRAYAGSITAMDDQIGSVLTALERKKMLENTIVVFQSDNGGVRNAMFSGAIADVAKATIPCDNGPYREGKGTLYEGGTRVCALVNWPGHIRAGGTVNGLMHSVDWYPTLAAIAGAGTSKAKPLDGMDMLPTVVDGRPSPRTEMVYNIEPFRAAIRQGDWKLLWRNLLPQSVELYDIAQDPSEKTNLADQHPDTVATLEKRINVLAAEGVKPTFLEIEFKAIAKKIHLPPAFPGEELDFAQER